jgi:hypothetical protein
MQPKDTQSVEDSLLCVRIEAFLDSLDQHSSDWIEYDSANFYLEASINYHYGRANNAYGESLTDSFEVVMTTSDYDRITYDEILIARNQIIDSLKVIYDDIEDDSKFMIYAMVFPLDHNQYDVRYRIYTAFGWGDYVEFDEEEPYDLRTNSHWQTGAPLLIRNAAMALYGYMAPTNPSLSFYTDVRYRTWKWHGSDWKVYVPETGLYYTVAIANPNPPIDPNYMTYRIFWQEHYNYNPPLGQHENLSGTEINFYTQQVNWLNYTSYGIPTWAHVFCNLYISGHETLLIIPPYGWDYRYHFYKMWYGNPKKLASTIYQKEFCDW